MIEEGPTKGTTLKFLRCAIATTSAPGSATAGYPASEIILSVMGSGFNGQSFAFHGYLPIEPGERAKKLKALEQRMYNEHQTQLFIETPYRNNKMIEDILHNCRPQTKLYP